MTKNKKGLSDIITTVLIILLALAAILILWQFIRTQLQHGVTSIQTSTDCLALELAPTSCTYNSTSANVVVKWAAGDVNLQKVNFIVTDGNGTNSISTGDATGTTILSSLSSTVNISGLDTSSLTLTAAGVIKIKSGETGTCRESTENKIACTAM